MIPDDLVILWFHEGTLEIEHSPAFFVGSMDVIDVEEGLYDQAFDTAGGRVRARTETEERPERGLRGLLWRWLPEQLIIKDWYEPPTEASRAQLEQLMRAHTDVQDEALTVDELVDIAITRYG